MTVFAQKTLRFRHAVLIEMRSRGYEIAVCRGLYKKDVLRYTIWNREGNVLLDDVMSGVCDYALRLWCDAYGFVPSVEQINAAPLSLL